MIDDLNGIETKVRIPLEDWVKEIADRSARTAAQEVIKKHQNNCKAVAMVPVIKKTVEKVESLRLRYVALIAFMAGSGMLGGGLGVLLTRVLK